MFRVDSEGRLVLNDAVRTLMDSVQKKGNNDVKYQTDLRLYDTPEHWSYPKLENGKLYGDCEDIAIYKRKLLVEGGVPSKSLLMTICLDPQEVGHCVLCVVTDKRDYILCNSHSRVLTVSDMRFEGYKFLYRQKPGQPITQPWDVLVK